MIFRKSDLTYYISAVSTLLSIFAATPATASDLQTLWCDPEEAAPFFVFVEGDEIWVGETKMEVVKGSLTESDNDAWLVNNERATMLGLEELGSAGGVRLSGMREGEQVTVQCDDISTIFLAGIAISQPLISEQISRSEENNFLANARIANLSAELQAKTDELAMLREEVSNEQASFEAKVARVDDALDRMSELGYERSLLEGFSALIRRDMAEFTNLPNDFVERFNSRYWELVDDLGRTPRL